MPEQEYTLHIQREVTQEWVDDSTLGSGALDWEWWRAVTADDDGLNLTVADPDDEGGDGEATITKFMRWGEFVKAANELCASDYAGRWLVIQQLANEDMDADGADQILQWHMFGEVVYG
jgi:hypothetical protein